MNYWLRERMNEECDFIVGYTVVYELANPSNTKGTKLIRRDFDDENSALKFIIELLKISNQISLYLLSELHALQNCSLNDNALEPQPELSKRSTKKRSPF